MIVFLCSIIQILQNCGNKNDATIVLKKNVFTLTEAIISSFNIYIIYSIILYLCMSYEKKII